MQKSRLGISVGMLGAAVCFMGLFGGYTPILIAAGYVLLFEENAWLKKNSVKAVAVMIGISVFCTAIGYIPDAISLVSSLLNIFGSHFSISIVSNIVSFVVEAMSLIRSLILFMMGLKALNQGTVSVPVIDNLIDKHMAA
ncbi:MAG: hypothetical protein K2G89_00495 [Lachnospiraceae bacterium]|nr:hypothetical protein [Lachnospiraceae bacterium]